MQKKNGSPIMIMKDAGFRSGSRGLAYRILKGATISWRVPKGATLYFGQRTQHKGFALRDEPYEKRSSRRGIHSSTQISHIESW